MRRIKIIFVILLILTPAFIYWMLHSGEPGVFLDCLLILFESVVVYMFCVHPWIYKYLRYTHKKSKGLTSYFTDI